MKTEESISGFNDLLSRGKLMNPSFKLGDMLSKVFALVDANSTDIRKKSTPSNKAGIVIWSKFLDASAIVCERQHAMFSFRFVKTICNSFFENRRRQSIESVVYHRVASLRKCRQDKI